MIGATEPEERHRPAHVTTRALPIFGGTSDPDTDAAFSMRVRLAPAWSRQCTAILIAPNRFLTARHCLVNGVELRGCDEGFPELVAPASVELTSAARLDSQEAAQIPVYRASTIHVPDRDEPCGADIAVIGIEEIVEGIMPLTPHLDDFLREGETYAAVGYGVQGEFSGGEGTRRRLEALSVKCIGDTCGSTVAAGEFLGQKGPCEGDSGGPALGTGTEFIGVLSRGTTACTHPIYVMPATFAEFLRDQALEAASAGGYPPPSWTEGRSEDPAPGSAGGPNTGSAGTAGAAGSASESHSLAPREPSSDSCTYSAGAAALAGRGGPLPYHLPWLLALTGLVRHHRRRRS